jgi:hypothetical protein
VARSPRSSPAGRRLAKHKTTTKTTTGLTAARKRVHTERVRRWWAEHEQTGDLPAWRANGRIPRAVYDAHQQAHPASNH